MGLRPGLHALPPVGAAVSRMMKHKARHAAPFSWACAASRAAPLMFDAKAILQAHFPPRMKRFRLDRGEPLC